MAKYEALPPPTAPPNSMCASLPSSIPYSGHAQPWTGPTTGPHHPTSPLYQASADRDAHGLCRASLAPPPGSSSVYLNFQTGRPGTALGGSEGSGGVQGKQPVGTASLDRAFDKFDRDGSGYLSMQDVAAALRSLGKEVTPKTLAHFADADADADGALRLGEFRALIATLESEGRKEFTSASTRVGGVGACAGGSDVHVDVAELMEAKVIFDRHDRDRNGFLATRELRQALKDLHLQADSAHAIAVLHEYDRDADGRLDLAEFARLLRRLRSFQGLTGGAAGSRIDSLRTAFRAYDSRGVGTVSVADVRPALIRAGIDTSTGVAMAIFASLQDQPRTAIDFAQFQRIGHAITSAGSGASPPSFASFNDVGLRAKYSPHARPQQPGPAHPDRPFTTTELPPRSAYPPTYASNYPPVASSCPPPSTGGMGGGGGSGGVSAFPPGYTPTDRGGGGSLSPGRSGLGGGCLGRAVSSPATKGALLSSEQARRLARKPHSPARRPVDGRSDPYALVPPGPRGGLKPRSLI